MESEVLWHEWQFHMSYYIQKIDYTGKAEKLGVKCLELEIKSVEYSTSCQMCKSTHTEGTT